MVYIQVLKAFQTWHLRRLAHVTENARPSDAVTQLIAYRETYKGQSAMESALRACGRPSVHLTQPISRPGGKKL